MKIGIDIDDTITDSWNTFIPYYAKLFNVSEEKLKMGKPYYASVKDCCNIEEYFEKIKPIYDEITPSIPIKKEAKEMIYKLHTLGHKIIFITSRGKGFTNSYNLTKEYLDKNNIYYDKILVNIQDKARACIDEKIALFIDDSYKHCKTVSECGINVLMMDACYNKEYKEFKRVNNWKEIYEYIKGR